MNREIIKPGSVGKAIRFSTDAFPARNRAAMFREYVRNQIVRFDHEFLIERISLEGVGMKLPGFAVVAVDLTPVRTARTRETMKDGNDNLRLVLLKHATSPAPATQLGRDMIVQPGDAVILSNCDANAITFTAPRSRMLSLNLARDKLRPLLQDFDAVLARTIPSQFAALRLLVRYVESLIAEAVPPTPELRQLVLTHIYDLAALAMGATRDACEVAAGRGVRAARLREIKSDIAANLCLQDLSVGRIARRQRVTPRYVQALFDHDGTTFTEFVRQARLDRAYRLLVDPRMADRSIGAIAFDVGFGDLS